MPPTLPFAQFEMSGPMRAESVFSFIGFTLVFLLATWLVDDRKRPMGTKLILWGIFVEILAVGYGMAGTAGVMMVIPSLTKIGFLLVLSGVGSSLLTSGPVPPQSKEADHV